MEIPSIPIGIDIDKFRDGFEQGLKNKIATIDDGKIYNKFIKRKLIKYLDKWTKKGRPVIISNK